MGNKKRPHFCRLRWFCLCLTHKFSSYGFNSNICSCSLPVP
nr:MAG TPA: hypothetical protein [Caudoviricetes sp.]